MQEVTVKLLGHLRLRVGLAEVRLEVEGPTTVKALVSRLGDRYPAFQEIFSKSPMVIAIDDEVTDLDSVVSAGATLTFYPPLSGG